MLIRDLLTTKEAAEVLRVSLKPRRVTRGFNRYCSSRSMEWYMLARIANQLPVAKIKRIIAELIKYQAARRNWIVKHFILHLPVVNSRVHARHAHAKGAVVQVYPPCCADSE